MPILAPTPHSIEVENAKNNVENVRFYLGFESRYKSELDNAASTFYLLETSAQNDIYRSITIKLNSQFENKEISSNVYKTSFDVIQSLPESIIRKINLEDIYSTEYGTIVLDWQSFKKNSNDEFSLEIGNNCMGYFYENDGEDMLNIQEVKTTDEEINILHKNIEAFFQGQQ